MAGHSQVFMIASVLFCALCYRVIRALAYNSAGLMRILLTNATELTPAFWIGTSNTY